MTSKEQNERHAKWYSLIAQQQNSGLSQKIFCEQHKLSLDKFSYYKSVMKEKSKNAVDLATKDAKFSEIKIAKQKVSASYYGDIKIILPNGFQCVFQKHIDIANLKTLLGALMSC